jgi:polyhydroxybutyrate depolymerase
VGSSAAILFGPPLLRQLTGQTRVASVQAGELTRTYLLHVPARLATRPGLVVALHGARSSGLELEAESGLDAQADRLGWVVAYPEGVGRDWDSFACCHRPGVDDVAFVRTLIDRLVAARGIDPDRVYVTGHSRGAMLAYRLGCELGPRLAAIAPVAGNMADSGGSARAVDCRPGRRLSVLAINGAEDPEIPIAGGPSRVLREGIAYAPLDDVIGRWRELDGCAGRPSFRASGSATSRAWSCAGGSQVRSIVVAGGGHAWPGAGLVNPPWSPAAAFDAAGTIAAFFAAHPATQ